MKLIIRLGNFDMGGLSTRERFGLFSYRVKELRNTRFVQKELGHVKYSISWNAVSGLLRVSLSDVDEELFRSFLLTFRQFISQKEPVFINRIFNDCYQYLRSDYYKELTVKARAEWRQAFERLGPIAISINEKQLTGEYLLDLWINGYYFHNDSEKLRELRRLLQGDLHLVRFKLLQVISAMVQILLFMGALVELCLREDLFIFPEEQ